MHQFGFLMEVKFALAEGRKKGQMSVEDAGRKGGQKGGRRTAETHGREFYEEIGHKGGQKVRRLIQEGKEHEEE
jgi:uncharacterized protein